MIGDMMRRSSRADHVEKLLMMTASLRKQHSVEPTVTSENNDKKADKRWNKFDRISNQTQINRLTIESVENSKLGLSSFDIIDVLGKGSFGEVFLVRKKG